MSAALVDLLMQLEPVFRDADPDFSVEKMYGQHIDYYRANPALQREAPVRQRRDRARCATTSAGDTILVDMSYIYDARRTAIGHTLIWRERDGRAGGQAEVAGGRQRRRAGRLLARLTLDGKTGFVRDIAGGPERRLRPVEASVRRLRRRAWARVVAGRPDAHASTPISRACSASCRTASTTTVTPARRRPFDDPDDRGRRRSARPRDQHRRRRPVPPHRGAGLLAGGDGRDDRGARRVGEGLGPVVAPGRRPRRGGDEGRRRTAAPSSPRPSRRWPASSRRARRSPTSPR